ncbi:hypothetical protein A3B35_03125 [Candidatus Kaiserbacteria bacterium RIFCSPLOWO2_01_FULL_54_24]|nr:MAG: hypothetical protein A3B35_03125 [Candidatus Kaiserbacteria bacterium RIFCSPLOWO2_01_FULL_54_24]
MRAREELGRGKMRITIEDLLFNALADHGPVSDNIFDVAHFSARKVRNKLGLDLADDDWKRLALIKYRFKGYPTISPITIEVHIIVELLDRPLGTMFKKETDVSHEVPYAAFSGWDMNRKKTEAGELATKVLTAISRLLTEIDRELRAAREYVRTSKTGS